MSTTQIFTILSRLRPPFSSHVPSLTPILVVQVFPRLLSDSLNWCTLTYPEYQAYNNKTDFRSYCTNSHSDSVQISTIFIKTVTLSSCDANDVIALRHLRKFQMLYGNKSVNSNSISINIKLLLFNSNNKCLFLPQLPDKLLVWDYF